MPLILLYIAIGAALGAVGRYQLTLFFSKIDGLIFPYATLSVNFIGSFFIGMVTAILGHHITTETILHPLVVVGFLGALTTFSTFSLDNFLLLRHKRYSIVLINIASNLFLGLSAVSIGYLLFS